MAIKKQNPPPEEQKAAGVVLAKRLGTTLKEAREARKLSVKDVARETNMIPRYIEALENEDYSFFPGETYALGFLRSYSEFLNLDTERLINLYHGLQIEQSETPLRELTKPTRLNPLPVKKLAVIVFGAALVGLVATLFWSGTIRLPNWSFSQAGGFGAPCSKRSIRNVTLPPGDAKPLIESLTKNNSLKFSFDALNIKLCLTAIKKVNGIPEGVFSLQVNEERKHVFNAAQGRTVILDSSIKALKELKHGIYITNRVLGETAARIQIFYRGSGAPPQTDVIRVRLNFVEKSYLSWEDDGNTHSGKLYEKGESRILEAKNRLFIKIGSGAGVRIGRGDKLEPAGPPGKIVKITYKRVPDPLDASKFRIEVSREVER